MWTPANYFSIHDDLVARIFRGADFAWDPLHRLEELIAELAGGTRALKGEVHLKSEIEEGLVYLEAGGRIEAGALVESPAYIGAGAVVRHGALLRANVILLAGSILGHASEAKHSLFLPNAHAPHFNYVGDSILGERVNLGAGTKLSNLSMNSRKDPQSGERPTIVIEADGQSIDTGLTKLGAILGDDVQTGCNAVLNPGCLVGPRTLVYPNLSLRKGVHPADSIIKLRQATTTLPRR